MVKNFLLLGLLILNACGLTPLHQKKHYDAGIFANIRIAQVSGVEKLKIKKKILDILELNPSEEYLYELKINYNRNSNSLGIARDGISYRYGIDYSLSYNLIDSKKNFEIANDNITLQSSYEVSDSEFSNFMTGYKADDDIENQLIEELKNRIYLDLKSYQNAHQ